MAPSGSFLAAALAVGCLALPSPSLAQGHPRDLSQVSIEELMNIEVTAAGRKRQLVVDVPAAVFVITQDDIRRSGLRTVPELLRLVPGAQVVQINSDKWAVSIRGFNQLYANKLLVLVDGRSVYNRSFSGVYWESIDMLLDDIDRIEVVRGPGGATWGANAVNGVINIVTKSASETKGGFVRLGMATFDGSQVSARYGGARGRAAYRVFSQWSRHGDTVLEAGPPAGDDWTSLVSGLRVDWAGQKSALMLDAGAVASRSHSLWLELAGPTSGIPAWTGARSDLNSANVLGRWTSTPDGPSSWQVQGSADVRYRTQAGTPEHESIFDIDAQYHAKAVGRHDVVTGASYRFVSTWSAASFTHSLAPAASEIAVASAFVQDEFAAGSRVRVTLGGRLEHDTVAAWGLAPTARVLWDISPQRQQVWAGIARARRTPSVSDLNLRLNYATVPGPQGIPVVLGIMGNPAFSSESFVSAEMGYRLQLGHRASVDLAAFRGHYDSLQTNEPVAPMLEPLPAPAHLLVRTQFGNLLDVNTAGAEVVANWIPDSRWRFDGSFSAFRLVPHRDPASTDVAKDRFDGNAPARSAQLRSTIKLGPRAEWMAAIYRVGALRELGVPAYTRVDTRLEYALSGGLSIVAGGQNLLDRSHAEQVGRAGTAATLVPRSASVSVVWKSQ
ncbi:MAG: TonB-dependent receptor [Vicinamibacterales bacterium]